MFPGLHPMAMMSTVGMGFSPSVRGTPPAAAPGMYPPGAAPYAQAGPVGVGVGGGGVYPPGMVPPTGSQQVKHLRIDLFLLLSLIIICNFFFSGAFIYFLKLRYIIYLS